MSGVESTFSPAMGVGQMNTEASQMLQNFWPRSQDIIKDMVPNDFKTQELPLARIKKIMKLDEDVKMISAEAPVLFAKAAEIFISELSLRAWIHTEDNKRRTLQRNDIAMAISKFDQFDFLIDIVPRDELNKPTKRSDENVQRTSMMPDQVQYYFQLAQQHQAALQQQAQPAQQTTQQQPQQIQLQAGQVIQQPVQVQVAGGSTVPTGTIVAQGGGDAMQAQPQIIQLQQAAAPAAAQPVQQPVQQQQVQQQPAQQPAAQQQPAQQQQPQQQQAQPTTQVFHQIVTSTGEVQNVPIALSQAQLQAIQQQLQGKAPGQPIIIQTAAPVQTQQQTEQTTQTQTQFTANPQPLFQIQQVPVNTGAQQVYIQQPAQAGGTTEGEQPQAEVQADVQAT